MLPPEGPCHDAEPVRVPGFDTEETLRRLGNDVGLYHDLLALVASSIANSLAQLDAALRCDDRAGFRLIGHTVRGMALNVGAHALAGVATGLERQPSPQAAAELRALLEQTMQAVRTALPG